MAFGCSLPFSHVSCTFVVWVTAIPTGLALALTSSTLAGSTFVALGSLGCPANHDIVLAHLNEEPASSAITQKPVTHLTTEKAR